MIPHVSCSTLLRYCSGDSLAQIAWDRAHPPEPTPAMVLGSLVHCLVLEGDEIFDDRYITSAGIDRRTKAGREQYAALAGSGKTIIAPNMADQARVIARTICAQPAIARLLVAASRETTLDWHRDDRQCYGTGRLDALSLEHGAVVDLKVTGLVAYPARERAILGGIYRQLAFYRQLARANGLDVDAGIVVFACSTPPYEVVPVALPESVLSVGWMDMDTAWKAIDADWAAENYRPHTSELEEFVPPEWFLRRHFYNTL